MIMNTTDLSAGSRSSSLLPAFDVMSDETDGAFAVRAARVVLGAVACLGLTLASNTTRAATLVVTTLADHAANGPCDADCTLREAIVWSQPNDVITFAPGLSGTINLVGGLSPLSNNVTIAGPGADLITLDANSDPSDPEGEFRIFRISAAFPLFTIKGLTLQNGFATGLTGADGGGAIFAVNDLVLDGVVVQSSYSDTKGGGVLVREGHLTIRNSILRGNTAPAGGGFHATAATLTNTTISGNTATGGGGGGFFLLGNDDTVLNPVTLTNCTISGNTATGGGGFFGWKGNVTLTNSTVSDNSGGGEGGGFYMFGDATLVNSTISNNSAIRYGGFHLVSEAVEGIAGRLTMRNSVVADNTASTLANYYEFRAASSTVSFSLIESSHLPQTPNGTNGNITLIDPQLGPLQDNGGPTLTRALLSGSPAMDAGDNSTCAATDQRGVARPQDGDGNGSKICDMGAVEWLIEPVFANGFEDTPTP